MITENSQEKSDNVIVFPGARLEASSSASMQDAQK